ncbi:hypothetical protein DN069_23705 [Streptacidiphilus pinicola]|uniref:Uncharacterized protein n=1 Tax=Streptacidiphilus pinicola TaxID=2219663 RepID=A0A2X0IIB8_9ACTN|nr:hypothetical protein [Streptacidiphilus pinicola]RAG83121.1 hypothetical protein DN069_23705 [Streptacidiphilus pinicola]
MSRRLVAGALLALTLSAVGGLLAARAASADGTVATPVGPVLVSADGRRVSITETGQCLGSGVLRAREDDSVVALDFRMVPHSGRCVGGPQLLVWSVGLAAPLAARRLVDADGGAPVTVFRGADLLRPSALPPGYRLAYDAPGYAPGDEASGAVGGASTQWDPAVSTLFVHDGPGGPGSLWLVEEYGRHWPDGWPADPPLVTAQGRLARVGPNGLAWQERTGDGTPLSLALLSDAGLPTTSLLRVADSLAPVPCRTPAGNRPLTRPPCARLVQ